MGAGIAKSVERLATGWTTDGVGVRVPVGSRIYCMSFKPALGSTQLPIPGAKRPGHEDVHLPPTISVWRRGRIPPP
jgi:hypothetical protein